MSAIQESSYPEFCRIGIFWIVVISGTYHDVVTGKLASFSFSTCAQTCLVFLLTYQQLLPVSIHRTFQQMPVSVILNWCLLLWLRIHIKAPEMLQLKLEPTCFVEGKLAVPFPLLSPKDRHLFLQLIQLAGRGREKEATLNFSAQRAMKYTPEIHLRTHGLLIYSLD